jgi:ATP-dependent Lhr-like helicase
MQSFGFHPVVSAWFTEKFGSPTEPQKHGWPAIQSGEHTLIAAPTGSGKTLAAFLAALDQLFREGLSGQLPDETRVVYVSPLKALSNDIHKNLEEPLAGIRAALAASEGRTVEVRAEVRTGDTPPAKRQAIARKPPHILVTTPESLYLLLTSASGRKLLGTTRTLIADEIHAVAGNRRGSHLALSMERLAALTGRPLQRVGLSATQKPIEEVAKFLVGNGRLQPGAAMPEQSNPRCTIVDAGYKREMDLAIELPGSPLEAVMSNEVWSEVYHRLAALIAEHRTTLVFVNTRRLAERVTHHLGERLGADQVTSHHGSLSARLRLDAEHRLKRGELKALVATASLELGIDIGSVDLVCQIGSTRSIATLLQRVGRAEHRRGGFPKGRIFPLSRDELAECAATIRSVCRGELDCLQIPPKPLDVLAQQIVACAAVQDWDEDGLFELARAAYPYRNLSREEFDEVVRMLAEGFSTKRGRRAALIHHDAINHRVRGRRGAGLVALTSGGAIPDNADYRVVVEPGETFIGTVNEDFAVESIVGDVFQLGNASWRILGINSGTVRVEDAQGQPPGIPFWLGEAPGRTAELSSSVSDLRVDLEKRLAQATQDSIPKLLQTDTGLPEAGAQQLAEYFTTGYKALGVIPSQQKLVLERFFDESGGMQLVLHSPFGIHLNRGWGLALRKRFCRSFNFELQGAATDDAIILSLGTQHSFPLEEVFHYLNSKTVREILVQAMLDAPMFPVRWRWNATRALALPRHRGGHKVPAPLQRMEAENLMAAVFPDQLACLENIVGDREVPDHPLVRQTIEDCLTEAMDVNGLIEVLKRIEDGTIECVARDLPEPSPFAHEIVHAKPYAFLDNAPLEERRTQAVLTRRAGDSNSELGILDPAAIEKVCAEAWPRATNPDELHEALLLVGTMTEEEIARTGAAPENGEVSPRNRLSSPGAFPHQGNGQPELPGPRSGNGESGQPETEGSELWLGRLTEEKRAGRSLAPRRFWLATERIPMASAVYPSLQLESKLTPPEAEAKRQWEPEEALRELVRGRMEVSGPVTADALVDLFGLPRSQIDGALIALEAEGFILRGKFRPDVLELEWCDRRLLARIHRLTLNRLRAEIQPVSIADFQRFLLAWQRVDAEHRGAGPDGLEAVVELLDGYGLAAAAWEPEVLALRVKDYTPQWLDQLCSAGRIGWGRLAPPGNQKGRPSGPVRSSPVSLFARENLHHWLRLSEEPAHPQFTPDTERVLDALVRGGALFFGEIVKRAGLLPSRVEEALSELSAQGWVTADSFEGLRALLTPQDKRAPFADQERRRRHKAVTSVEFAGRWSLLRIPPEPAAPPAPVQTKKDEAVEAFAHGLLQRYGVVFRRMLERESLNASWYELGRVYRRLEARGTIRGGYFVSGVSGEQFALPEAIGLLRSTGNAASTGEFVVISGADPMNLVGILAPGPRVTAIAANRILLRDGVPVAALEGGKIIKLEGITPEPDRVIEQTLRIGSMPAPLRPYYA